MKFILLALLFTEPAFAICLLPSDATVYNCEKIQDSHSDQVCNEQFGEEFDAYYPSDICTGELAAELRGESVQADTIEANIAVSCLKYETGQEQGCRIWDYEAAYNYCAQNFGDQYLPHYLSGSCSEELAKREAGIISSSDLNLGLSSHLAEVEAIMTMIDREGMRETGLISFQPVIGNDFYTPVMKGLLAKLSDIRESLQQRSLRKVDMEDEGTKQFLQYVLRYINMTNRVHKVFAYVAHRNYKALNTYNFSTLDFLNLRLGRPLALEILSHINMKVKTVGANTLELYQSEQSKQMYEYMAISEPKDGVDYAKLVNFLGIRETMTNLWAVDRMSEQNLLAPRIRSCGAYMSFQGRGSISSWPGMHENIEYDVFYNEYLPRADELKNTLKSISLISQNHTALLAEIYSKSEGLRQLVDEYLGGEPSETQVREHFEQDINLLREGILSDWEQFSEYHFKTFVMPGDGVLSPIRIAQRISTQLYLRQETALVHGLVGLYPWIPNEEIDSIKNMTKQYVRANIKESLQRQVEAIVIRKLDNYNDTETVAQKNLDLKINETYEVARKYSGYGALSVSLDKSHGGSGVDIQPSSVDQLMLLFENKVAKDFQDIKLTMEKKPRLASALSEFLQKVTEKFNSEFLEMVGFNDFKLKGSRRERAEALWNALYDTARDYYLDNRFEITQMAMVPEATLLARDHNSMARNPYLIQVYRDGTPVTVSLAEFYDAFEIDLGISISSQDLRNRNQTAALFGVNLLNQRGERDLQASLITDGTFDRPRNYISARGHIRLDRVSRNIDRRALERLYLLSLDFSAKEMRENSQLQQQQSEQRREMDQEYYEDVDVLQNSRQLFARIFELFEIPMGSIANGRKQVGFKLSFEDKKYLVKSELAKAYGESPVLRNKLKTEEEESYIYCPSYPGVMCLRPQTRTRTKQVTRSLLEKIGHHAYSDGQINLSMAKRFIRSVINHAKEHTQGKLQTFCSSDYRNYKDDENFKKVFKASEYIRATLKNDSGTTLQNSLRIQELDEQVDRDLKSILERITDDYLEPTLMILGLVTLVAVGVMLSIGSMGTAAPASLAATSAYIGIFLSASNYIFLPLVIATTYSRVNTQFIEVPAQLKFQESLAHSQVDFAKVADHDLIEQQRRENRISSYWTLGFMPLDLYFGYTVGKQVRTAIGVSGIRSYQRLTGIKLRGFSAPPKSLRSNTHFRQLRRDYGALKGSLRYANQTTRNLLSRLPRYQAVPEELIRTAALRQGIARKLKDLRLHRNPWVLNDEIKVFRDKIRSRLTQYRAYNIAEASVVEKVKLNGRLHFQELLEHGTRYSRFTFTLKSFMKAIKERRALSYLRNYGEVVEELKHLQGELIKRKLSRIETLVDKIDEFQRLRNADRELIQGSTELVDDMLKNLTDDEILLFETIAKKSAGNIRELRSVFRDYHELTNSLKPLTYLYGQPGEQLQSQNKAAMSFLRDDSVHGYTFQSDSQDIVQFYEALIRQNAFKDEGSQLLRRAIEERISRLFTINAQGRRVYL